MKKQFKYLFYYLILFGMVPSFTQAGVVKMDLASTTGVLTEISNENINIKIGDLNLPSRINSETRFLGREGKPLSIEEIKLLLTKFKDLGFSGIPVKSNYNKTGVAKDIQLDFQSFDNANKNLIKNIQVLLNSLGYEPGPIDGEGKEQTILAIKKFQENEKINITGEMSKKLYHQLIQKKGCGLVEKDNWKVSVECYSILIEGDPNNSINYSNLGVAYYNLHKFNLALDNLNKALKIDSNNSHALMNRGATYLQMGKYNLAIEDFSEIIKRDPNSSDAYNNRGLAYHMSGKKEKACNDIRKGCDLGNCVALETAKKKKLCQ